MASFPAALTPTSGRVKAARKLARRASRYEHRLFLAEGIKALTEALEVPGCVVEVFATEQASADHADLRQTLGDAWHLSTDAAVESLAGAVTPQGIVAVCRFIDRPLRDVIESATTVVVCADVRDPGNAGTVIRTADAAGFDAVVLAGNSVDPYNDKTVRATVGSLFHPRLSLGGEPATVVETLRAAGFTVLAADGAGEISLFDTGQFLGGKVAWLFGNEAWGLPDDLAALADHRIAIPILGRAESLNLATAAALCLYASAQARS